MILDDSELISRVLAYDDHYAYSQLVKKYQSPIRLFLRRLSDGKQEIADELAQETFMLAYKKLETFQGKSLFRTWLYAIARNQFLQFIRKNKKNFHWDDEMGGADMGGTEMVGAEMGPNQTDHKKVQFMDERMDLEVAMKHLRPIEKAVVTLSYAQDLSHGDVAEILEIPIGSVKTHLLRGKEKLKTQLSGYQSRG